MKRLFWLGVGLAAGALVVRAVSKKAKAYSPRGIAAATRDSGRNLFDSVRDFVDDVRDGMHEREHELRTALAAGVSIDELDADLSLEEFEELEQLEDEDFDEVFGGAADAPDGSVRDKETT
jgi:hypothetical protein